VVDGKVTKTWQWASNYGWWQKSDYDADTNYNRTTINKCEAVEAENDNSLQEMMNEQQWCSRQATAVNDGGQWWLS
jgi:hypothetical protein